MSVKNTNYNFLINEVKMSFQLIYYIQLKLMTAHLHNEVSGI